MKNSIRFGAAITASALVLAACSAAPEATPAPTDDTATPVETVDYKPCIVSDAGGFDDRSFNQAGYEGLQEVVAAYGMDTAQAESADDTEYEPNISALVAADCDMIITVGFLLGDATANAAAANPDVDFAIIDFAYNEPIDNVKPLLFNTDEAAFLAGYAAAATTQTGTVATFGGIPIPPVTIFMDGFLSGVNYHNETQGTTVQVLGWDGTDGSFTGNFDDQTAGQNLTTGFIDQGADIILPVAGPVGLGAAAAAREAGNVWIIGVDQDWVVTAPEYADIIFTSIMKNMGPAVYDVVETTAVGAGFSNAPYFGTLENEGVGIADFRDAPVSDELLAALEEIRAGIIDGSITP
ncbi:MAG: BMP family ABC transporter substrate-binding protein [Actinobacteria bacterium HGW-Actinobacteria-4]|nr:MAG: BMP family ABC transporter substrate-binding protein [Actinobacteria bacterium HGW-Actinobacteria-4]